MTTIAAVGRKPRQLKNRKFRRSQKAPKLSRCRVQHFPLKRMFDITFSTLVLTLGSPVFLLLALLVKCTSKGPVFYSQKRIGRGGQIFDCYKFRSMRVDADERLKKILAEDPEARTQWERTHKLRNDPRVTPVGAFLRKTSLDELPQFLNVLRGDLSVVGPRPVVELELTRHLGRKAAKILSIRPGLTGLWQTSGRSDTSYKTRLSLDEKYIDNRSFLLDLKLIAKTIPVMIFSRGAY